MGGICSAHFYGSQEEKVREINLYSFAKINLSIDVGAAMDSGMHPVDMIMQQLAFHDDVRVSYSPDEGLERGKFKISVSTNRRFLPVDGRNLAYKAAELMVEKFGGEVPGGDIHIDIRKRIPVAAGLAGGSGNAAAVLHGLNVLWGGRRRYLTGLDELLAAGSELGSDVPFCVAGQARGTPGLPAALRRNPRSGCCARATGTGTELKMIKALKSWVVIAKPGISVSTAEVYKGIDNCIISARPDNDILEQAIIAGDTAKAENQMINVLENYTLKAYPEVEKLKEKIRSQETGAVARKVLMSGSGPTVFALFDTLEQAKTSCENIRKSGYEAYWTKTTV